MRVALSLLTRTVALGGGDARLARAVGFVEPDLLIGALVAALGKTIHVSNNRQFTKEKVNPKP